MRKTSSRLKLRTDASMRFEKAQDPVNTVRGLRRAPWSCSNKFLRASGLSAAWPTPTVPCPRRRHRACRSTGSTANSAAPSPPPKCAAILESLEFSVEEIDPRTLFRLRRRAGAPPRTSPSRTIWWKKSAAWSATIPSRPSRRSRPRAFRPPIPSESFIIACAKWPPRRASPKSTTTPSSAMKWHAPCRSIRSHIMSGRQPHRRRSEPAARAVCCRESGKTSATTPATSTNSACLKSAAKSHKDREIPHLAAAIYAKDDGVAGLFELKRLAECLLPGVTVRPAPQRLTYEHPQRAADVFHGEHASAGCSSSIPRLVEGRPRRCARSRSRRARETPATASRRYQPLRRFPTSAFDLSVVAPARALIGDVESHLNSSPAKTWFRSPSCATSPCPMAAQPVLPPDRRRRRPHARLRRSRRHPHPHHRRHAPGRLRTQSLRVGQVPDLPSGFVLLQLAKAGRRPALRRTQRFAAFARISF